MHTKRHPKLTRGYRKLIEKFPPRPIKNAKQKAEASKLACELAMKGASARTVDETDYLAVLGLLITDYERTLPRVREFLNEVKGITPAEALSYLMEENNLTQSQLATEIGADQGNLSAFLVGKRGLSKTLAVKLAHRFKVSVELFLPRPDYVKLAQSEVARLNSASVAEQNTHLNKAHIKQKIIGKIDLHPKYDYKRLRSRK